MKHARQHETENAQKHYAIVPLPAVLDLQTVPYVRKQLLEQLVDKVNVRVDMSGVCTMDTAAIAVFVECLRVAKDHGVTFAVVRPPECALRLLRLTKVDQLLAGALDGVSGDSHPLGPRTILPHPCHVRRERNTSGAKRSYDPVHPYDAVALTA